MIKLLIILILISIIILSTLKEKYINQKKKLTIFTS